MTEDAAAQKSSIEKLTGDVEVLHEAQAREAERARQAEKERLELLERLERLERAFAESQNP